MKYSIIDKLSLASSEFWGDVDSRLKNTFRILAFTKLLVVTVADFLQVPPVIEKLTFLQFFNKESMTY